MTDSSTRSRTNARSAAGSATGTTTSSRNDRGDGLRKSSTRMKIARGGAMPTGPSRMKSAARGGAVTMTDLVSAGLGGRPELGGGHFLHGAVLQQHQPPGLRRSLLIGQHGAGTSVAGAPVHDVLAALDLAPGAWQSRV